MLCEPSQNHVLLMKKAVEVPFKELVEGPAPELKIEEICELSDDGISIRRVYVNTDQDHPFAEVGWVHNEDVISCMSCEQEFGFFRWRHHCRTCGLLVCGDCTATATIQGYASLGEQTVCNKCISKVSIASACRTRRCFSWQIFPSVFTPSNLISATILPTVYSRPHLRAKCRCRRRVCGAMKSTERQTGPCTRLV